MIRRGVRNILPLVDGRKDVHVAAMVNCRRCECLANIEAD